MASVSNDRNKGGWQIAAGVVLLLLTALGGYVGCYITLSTRSQFVLMNRNGPALVIERTFATQWQARLFYPAAQVEGVLIRQRVEVGHIETPTAQ